jgi:hypothetical protein
MHTEILQVIKDYLTLTRKYVAELRQEFGQQNLLRGVAAKAIPREGCLDKDKKVKFAFHGVGCCIETDEFVLDFDFGPNDRTDGFDAWRLYHFAQSRRSTGTASLSLEDFERVLAELEREEIVERFDTPPSPHLYYFVNRQPGESREQVSK